MTPDEAIARLEATLAELRAGRADVTPAAAPPLPVTVAPGELIQSSWGNSVRSYMNYITTDFNHGANNFRGGAKIIGGTGIVQADANGVFSVTFGSGGFAAGTIPMVVCANHTANPWFVGIYYVSNTRFEGQLKDHDGTLLPNRQFDHQYIAIGQAYVA